MGTSYLSLNDIAVRGAETGFGKGVQLEHEDYQLSQNAEREDFREKMLNERYQLQLKNALAEKSLYYTHESERIANMDAKTAAHDQNTKMVNAAFQTLNENIAMAKNALLPQNRTNITDASAKSAEDLIAAAQRSRFAIASLQPQPTPGNIHGVFDRNQIEALTHPVDKNGNPISFTPEFTPQYQAMQKAKLDAENAKVAHTIATTNKLTNPAALSAKDIQKAQNDFAKNIYAFNGLKNNVEVSSQPLADLQQEFDAPGRANIYFHGDMSRWKSESPTTLDDWKNENYQTNGAYDWTKTAIARTPIPQTPEGDKTLYHSALRGYHSSREKFITSPNTQATLSKLGNPFYTGSDVAGFVQAQKAKFGNFKSYEDVNSFLNYISNIKDTPTREGSYAKALDGILSGNFTPVGTSGDDTDTQDNSDEMAPPQQGGQEQQ